MRDHKANSKPYISLVLLFTFLLLSCQAHKHSYSDDGNNLEHPTLSQDLEKDWRHGYSMPNRMSLHRYDFQWAQPTPPIAKNDRHAHWIDYYRDPPAVKSDQHTYSVDHHGNLLAAKSHRQIGSIDYYRDPPAAESTHQIQWAQPNPPIAKSDHHAHWINYYRDPPAAESDRHTYSVDHHGDLPTAKSEGQIGSIDYYRNSPAAETTDHTYSVDYHRDPPASKSDQHRNVFQESAPHPDAKPGFYTHSTSAGYHRHDFQWADPPPPETKRDRHTYSVDHRHESLEDVEPWKNYEDGTVTRHRKMMKPSETGDNVVP